MGQKQEILEKNHLTTYKQNLACLTFPVFAVTLLSVVWYNGTINVTSKTKDVRTGDLTLNIYILNAFTEKPHSKLMRRNAVYNPVTTSSHGMSHDQ